MNFIWRVSVNSVLMLVVFQCSIHQRTSSLIPQNQPRAPLASFGLCLKARIGQGGGWLALLLWFVTTDRWWVPQNALNPTIPTPPSCSLEPSACVDTSFHLGPWHALENQAHVPLLISAAYSRHRVPLLLLPKSGHGYRSLKVLRGQIFWDPRVSHNWICSVHHDISWSGKTDFP